ncbi:unnamed protein product [Linum trigynum]|uniref:Uncharacterized protein n=1 Tax=Linum trigynum TaxID=586398 RepID=A0AAV2E1Y5_9ROSI
MRKQEPRKSQRKLMNMTQPLVIKFLKDMALKGYDWGLTRGRKRSTEKGVQSVGTSSPLEAKLDKLIEVIIEGKKQGKEPLVPYDWDASSGYEKAECQMMNEETTYYEQLNSISPVHTDRMSCLEELVTTFVDSSSKKFEKVERFIGEEIEKFSTIEVGLQSHQSLLTTFTTSMRIISQAALSQKQFDEAGVMTVTLRSGREAKELPPKNKPSETEDQDGAGSFPEQQGGTSANGGEKVDSVPPPE